MNILVYFACVGKGHFNSCRVRLVGLCRVSRAGTRGVPRALDRALRGDECLLLGAGSTGRRQLVPKEHKVKYIQASASSGSEIELLPRVRHGLRVRFCMRENKRTHVRQVLRAVGTHRPLKHSAGKGAVQRLGCHVAYKSFTLGAVYMR